MAQPATVLTLALRNGFHAAMEIVHSPSNRRLDLRRNERESILGASISGIAKQNKLIPLQIGGIEDHIHVLVGAPASPSKIAQLLKGGSSVWIHKQFPLLASFAWQDGYGGFTVSKPGLEEVMDYIRNQRKRHSRMADAIGVACRVWNDTAAHARVIAVLESRLRNGEPLEPRLLHELSVAYAASGNTLFARRVGIQD
jgi:putative transposase